MRLALLLICSIVSSPAFSETVTLLCVNKLNQLTLTINYDKSSIRDWNGNTFPAKVQSDSVSWDSTYGGRGLSNNLNRFTGMLTSSDNGTPLKCDVQSQRKF
jgi:hypothetical protein